MLLLLLLLYQLVLLLLPVLRVPSVCEYFRVRVRAGMLRLHLHRVVWNVPALRKCSSK